MQRRGYSGEDNLAEEDNKDFQAEEKEPTESIITPDTEENNQLENSEAVEEQKQQEIEIVDKGQNKLFCLNADGSDHSKFAFKLITQEFIKSNLFLAVYIYNSAHNEEYNFRNKREVVTVLYDTLIQTNFTDTQGHMITQNYKPQYVHPIEQVNRISAKNKANFFFCGYNGMKGPKSINAQLNIALDYLLREGVSPMVLIKDKSLRGENRKKSEQGFNGYKWLFVFDRAYSDCMKLLSIFLPLLDVNRDFIYGLTLLPSYILKDDIKTPFLAQLAEIGFNGTQYGYQKEGYLKDPSKIVCELVNFGEDHLFNFVVFNNSPNKYSIEKESSDCLKIIQKCSSNICFVNGSYSAY